MGQVLGVINFDHRTIYPTTLKKLQSQIPCDIEVTSKIWCQRNIGFAVGYEEFHSTSINFDVNSSERYKIITRARLDNKKELIKSLKIRVPHKEVEETIIILKAYEKWGKDCVHHILGDWVFAIWDSILEELFLARDHFGHSSIYYHYNGTTFIFASSLRAIISCDEVPKKLDESIIFELVPLQKRSRKSFYKDIYQLPSAHTLTVNKQAIKTSNYWLPVSKKIIHYSKDEAYVEHFLDLYTKAVNCRINTNGDTGITLSSGLDSSSIAALAVKALKPFDKKLYAYTWAPAFYNSEKLEEGYLFDESYLSRQLSNDLGGVIHQVVKNPDISFLQYLKLANKIFAQPLKSTIGYPFFEALIAAKKDNKPILLTGIQGNNIITYNGNQKKYFSQLLKNRAFDKFISEFIKWKRGHQLTWRSAFNQFLYQPLFSTRKKFRKKIPYLSIFNENVLKNLAIHKKEPSLLEAKRLQTSYSRSKRLLNVMNRGNLDLVCNWADYFGVELRSPTIDKRLIDFSLNIPESQYLNHTGNKLIFRKSMKNHLPKYILNAKKRGLQGGDLPDIFKREEKEFRELLYQIEQSPLSKKWINLKKVKNSFDFIFSDKQVKIEGVKKEYSHSIAMTHIEKAINIGLFFLEYEN